VNFYPVSRRRVEEIEKKRVALKARDSALIGPAAVNAMQVCRQERFFTRGGEALRHRYL
jgi:hypothetical protein